MIFVFIALVVVVGAFVYTRYYSGSTLISGIVHSEDASSLPSEIASGFSIEEVVRGLSVPWSIVWTSPDRMLVAERGGNIRVIERGVLLEKPLHEFSEVSVGGEEGLMSLVLHPRYSRNRYIYASLAYENDSGMWVKVVRFRDDGERVSSLTTIIDTIPGAQFHAGSRLVFGPDEKLYISTGDATDRTIAQDIQSLGGKILRLNDDGTIPQDNPFPGSPVWSFGHRNPQGISFDSAGTLYETEHGPSTFDGPPGGDEVNVIVKGGNYGWPLVSHENRKEGTEAPLLVFTPAEAPASALVYSGALFPEWKGNLFFGALRGEGIVRVVLDSSDPKKVVSYEKMSGISFGRIRDIAEGPDGALYFSTSNKDGRGIPHENDDRIFRIVRKQ